MAYRLIRAPDGTLLREYRFDDGTKGTIPDSEALRQQLAQMRAMVGAMNAEAEERVEKSIHARFSEHGAGKRGHTKDALYLDLSRRADELRSKQRSLTRDEALGDVIEKDNRKHPKRKRPLTLAAVKKGITRARQRERTNTPKRPDERSNKRV